MLLSKTSEMLSLMKSKNFQPAQLLVHLQLLLQNQHQHLYKHQDHKLWALLLLQLQ